MSGDSGLSLALLCSVPLLRTPACTSLWPGASAVKSMATGLQWCSRCLGQGESHKVVNLQHTTKGECSCRLA